MKKVDKNTPIGTKVVPIDKTAKGYCKLEDSPTWIRLGGKEQGFLYYQGYLNVPGILCTLAKCTQKQDISGGDVFNYSDLVLYEENQTAIDKVVFGENQKEILRKILESLEQPQTSGHNVSSGNTKSQPDFKLDTGKHFNTLPIQLPPAIQDRIKELEEEVKRLKEKYEPYDIGELYAFSNEEIDFEDNDFSLGKLTDVKLDDLDPFECNGYCWYKYARKIKTIELCQ